MTTGQLVGQQFGNYRLIRFIADGGFAEVYEGEHIELATPAAIKVLKASLPQNEIAKFRDEATTIAKLIHPHIVRVFDFGVSNNTPFMVMDYAPNGTLRQRHPRGTLVPLKTIVSYVKQVSEALQYAHNAKIIHRDVKPENMLIGRGDEIWLSDFGIAVLAHSTHSMILQNKAGTLAYMAPEQLQGKATIASDQYALGIVVYAWLCGEVPFTGTELEMVALHFSADPPSLRTKVPSITSEVEQVVLKALAKDPERRFASVQKFAQALEQASHSKKTSNLSPQPSSSLKPLPPTMPVVIQQASLGTLLCTYRGHTNGVASLIWSPNGFYVASIGTDQAVHIWNVTTGDSTFPSHFFVGRVAIWSPYGEYIAIGSSNGTIAVVDFGTGDTRITYHGHTYPIETLIWIHDGKHVVSKDSKGMTHVWSTISGDKEIVLSRNTILSPDGTRIAEISNNYTIQVWNIFTSSKIFTFRDQTNAIKCFAWSPDGSRIVSGNNNGSVQIYDTVVGNSSHLYHINRTKVESVAWSLDGEYIAAVFNHSSGIFTRYYNFNTFSSARRASIHLSGTLSEKPNNIIWSSTNSIVTESKERVNIWNDYSSAYSAYPVFDYYGYSALSNDRQRIATASEDKTLQIWNATNGKHIFTYQGHPGKVTTLAWSPDGTRIATATEIGMIHVWQA